MFPHFSSRRATGCCVLAEINRAVVVVVAVVAAPVLHRYLQVETTLAISEMGKVAKAKRRRKQFIVATGFRLSLSPSALN